MILKLALNGLKKKQRDYAILFTGLIISIAVFYMFLTLSLNKEFILQNSVINNIQLVFLVGTVMLSVITFFYLFYTNSFLLSLRKKEYGLYELIGAKKLQIRRVFQIETMAITGISLIIGLIFGIILSRVVSWLLMNQLNIGFTQFKVVYLPAVFWTMIYFLVTSFITSSVHNLWLAKISIIELLRSEIQNDLLPEKPKNAALMIFLGLFLLAIGYVALYFMETLRFIGLFTAPIATTLGTYVLFVALLPIIVRKWKRNKKVNFKGINSFTSGQLNFRLSSLKWVLATIALLIALSAGAIAGGFAFKNDAFTSINEHWQYDATLYNPGAAEMGVLDSIPVEEQLTYRMKLDDEFIYLVQDELNAAPPLIRDMVTYEVVRPDPLPEELEIEDGSQIVSDQWFTALYAINPALEGTRSTRIVPLEEYELAEGEEISIVLARTADFSAHIEEWQKLDELQMDIYPGLVTGFDPETDSVATKYAQFKTQYAIASGTFFMGFFLGLAFLTMMASILMFKILSGANNDIRRYDSLRKLGVRRKVLENSLSREIFIVFLFPGILGLLHVFVGMRMFTFIMDEPYYRLWVSTLIFLAIYGGYYFFTVHLYRKIVLPKQ
ncbi:FtsX-like permease family protein [Planomicrobium okeanokoites]|uniref:FtsX-like permease family protein n=1 Tax=Planomicrobium okeanokoites TaxID=244 RepID=UPI002492D2C3|nr:FtsX-like permease family protein [Planomicrobium okeanokoites]